MRLPNTSNKMVLISVLDWGFGHMTRCVPVIEALIESNNTVVFAGNDKQINFIEKEFPSIKTEYLEGYNIELSSKQNTYFQIIKQGFKITKAIKSERAFVKKMSSKYAIDLVLSDNRYGFRHSVVKSIFISHQLNLCLPTFSGSVNKVLSKLVNQFNEVWIADDEVVNLAGQLSNPLYLTVPHKYLGLLSRFKMDKTSIKYDYLIIVSGPNPENSLFLGEIERLVCNSDLKFAIVSTVQSSNELSQIDYFYNSTTLELNAVLNSSDVVISKSGYTTLMELSVLNKKAILIPTKGQFEQEYLASYIKNESFRFVKNSAEIKSLFA